MRQYYENQGDKEYADRKVTLYNIISHTRLFLQTGIAFTRKLIKKGNEKQTNLISYIVRAYIAKDIIQRLNS